MPPKVRPFRAVLLALYLGVTALLIGLLVRGVVVSIVTEMGLDRPAAGACGGETRDGCAASLQALAAELDEKLCAVDRSRGAASRLWDEWSVGWRRSLAAVEARCCLGGEKVPAGFGALARAARDLRELESLYATHVVQYSREIGAKAEDVDRELSDLRASGQTTPAPPPKTVPARP